MRALAVTSTTRAAATPDLPTVSESGLPAFEALAWFGVLPRPAQPPQGALPVIDDFALNADDRAGFEHRLKAAGQPFEIRCLADSDTW